MRTLTELLDTIDADPTLAGLRDLAAGDDDAAHGLDHLLRVALWTVRIGGDGIDSREAIATALLHDFVNVPKDDPRRAQASALSADAARPHLEAAGFADAAVERMTTAIRQHSFSRGETPTEPLACALQDADRLEALGAIGVLRCAATGGRMNAGMFHPDDPFALDRPLDDRAWSVDHFFAKLLRLPSTMRTEAGRAEATRRATVLRQLLEDLAVELGRDPVEVTAATHLHLR